MSIISRPQPKDDGWEREYVFWPRQIGEWRVAREWIKRKTESLPGYKFHTLIVAERTGQTLLDDIYTMGAW